MKIREETVHGVRFLRCDGFGPGVAHGFSTRLGGVSEGVYASMNLGFYRGDNPDRVRENFDRFCGAVEVAREGLVCSAQVHGDEVRVCTRADRGRGIDCPAEYEADALVTDVPGLVQEFPSRREEVAEGELLHGLRVRMGVHCAADDASAVAELQLGEAARFYPSDTALCAWASQVGTGTATVVYE